MAPKKPTVEGGGWVPYDSALSWSSARLSALVGALGLPTLIILCGPLKYGGFPWLGQHNLYGARVAPPDSSLDYYLSQLRAACV